MHKILLVTSLLSFALVGCQSYQHDLHQGTEITKQQVKKLKSNLSKEEVTLILGSPTLESLVDKKTWNYIYWTLSGKKRHKEPHYKSLTLHFNRKERLVAYEGDWDIKDLPLAEQLKKHEI